MVGNSLEDGILGDVKNPTHAAWTRPAALATLATWSLGGVFALSLDTFFLSLLAWCIVFLAGIAIGIWVYRKALNYAQKRTATLHADIRANREIETRRQLAEAKARGVFDKFGKASRP